MAAELLAQRQWVTQQTDFMQESLQQHLHTRAALENARHIPCNMACNYYHESKLSIAALCTVYTLRSANALQTYGPISGLMSPPANGRHAFTYERLQRTD